MVVLASTKFSKCVIHPTVLLGIVDHMNRVQNNTKDERVIGALMGTVKNGVIDITSSFGVPFMEQPNEDIWVLDVDYVDEMVNMCKKVNVKEKVVGWYQTGPKLRLNDIEINTRFQAINREIIAVLVDPKPKDLGFPTKAYIAVEETHEDGRPTTKTFQHLKIEIGAEEAEEVGVEHLLRDIGSADVHTLSQGMLNHFTSLKGLESYLNDISKYLNDVIEQKLPVNTEIIEKIQYILYELPLLTDSDVQKSLIIHNNDDAAVIFISMLSRTVFALNNLINNKQQARCSEEKPLASPIEKRPKSPPPQESS